MAKTLRKSCGEFSEQAIKSLATELGMSREEVIERLQKPWGLKQLLIGKWPNYARERRRSRAESRLEAALKLVHFSERENIPPQRIKTALDALEDEVPKEKRGNRSQTAS